MQFCKLHHTHSCIASEFFHPLGVLLDMHACPEHEDFHTEQHFGNSTEPLCRESRSFEIDTNVSLILRLPSTGQIPEIETQNNAKIAKVPVLIWTWAFKFKRRINMQSKRFTVYNYTLKKVPVQEQRVLFLLASSF